MRYFLNKPKIKGENAGLITVDFLFAFILVSGFSFALLSLTLTLSVVELTQYITFSSARTFMAAHTNLEKQKQMGRDKYIQLLENSVFSPLFQNGWFEIGDTPNIGNQSENPFEQANYPKVDELHYQFFGVNVGFTAHVLQFRIPLYGSTTGTDEDKNTFSTVIGSYLNREPTLHECQENFNKSRWLYIRQKKGGEAASYTSDNGYFPIMDNGC